MCEKPKNDDGSKKGLSRRPTLIGVVAFLVTVAAVIILVYLILRPTKPQFTLQDTTLYALNLSRPNFLTTTMQITLSARNPNRRIGIYYGTIQIYASYRDQQITVATELPQGTYLGHKEICVWSPFLYGDSLPVSQYLASAMSEDLNAGLVLVEIKVTGRLNWKVGTWMSGKYHLSVNCPAYLTFGERFNGGPFQYGVKYQLVKDCYVEV